MLLFINIVVIIVIIGTAISIIFHNIKKSKVHHCPIGKDCSCPIKQNIK